MAEDNEIIRKLDVIIAKLDALTTKVVTAQALTLSLGQQSGFSNDDITASASDLRDLIITMDPQPVEVDPEV